MASRTYTQDQLALRALQRLGEIGDGQPPSPESARKVRDALPGILADLEARGVYRVPAFDRIDAEAFGHLSAIVASEMSDDFGVTGDDIVLIASRAQAAEVKLRILSAIPAGPDAPAACYY